MAARPIATGVEAAPQPFEFHGSAGEFFRIWIVNLCLTVVTLGLYGPWAKVRTSRYFAANLRVSGSHFDYDADPRRILVGRLIVLASVGLYSLANWFYQPIGMAMAVAGAFLFPAAVIRSTAFHHRHTLFRGIRFRFWAPYFEAFKVLLLGPLFVTITLGLALPWWYSRRQAFVVKHSRYGTSAFEFEARVGPYYGVALGAALLFLLAAGSAGAGFALAGGAEAKEPEAIRNAILAAGVPAAILGSLGVALAHAGFTNLLYRNSRVGDLTFQSELKSLPLAWLYVSSGIAVMLSLGLLTPWARVRLARYRAGALSLLAPSGLDAFVQGSEPEEGAGALASEAADLFDFDLGL